MLLGEILERLGDETVAAEALAGLGDLPLMVGVEAAGRRLGETTADYAVGAVRRFAAFASDDDWLALVSSLERAEDPAAACLRHMLAWAVRDDAECPGS